MTSAPSRPAIAHLVALTRSDVLSASLARALTDASTTVAHCRTLEELDERDRPDIILLDRAMATDIDRVVRSIRRRWLTVTVVVVRVTDEADVGRVLDAGADDAVIDGSPVLQSRLHAHTRRVRTQNAGTRIAVGDLVFDREARRVWCAGVEVELSRTEEAVFDCLFWHFPNAVDLNAMTHFVWGEELTGDRRHLLRVYIGYLRQKLKASRNVAVLNVRGVGYALGVRGSSPRTSPIR